MCSVGIAGLAIGIAQMGISYMGKKTADKRAAQAAAENARQRNANMEATFQNDMRNWEYSWKVSQAEYETQMRNAGMQAGYNSRVHAQEMQKYHQQMAYAGMMRKNAKEAYDADMELHDAQGDQLNKKVDLDEFERKRQLGRDRAKIRVASGESGLTGVSIFRELSNSLTNAHYDIAIMESNRGNMNDQQEAKAKKLHATYQGRLNQAMNPIAPPSPMGSAAITAPIQAPMPVRGNPVASNYQGSNGWAMYGGLAMQGANLALNTDWGNLMGSGSASSTPYSFTPNNASYRVGAGPW